MRSAPIIVAFSDSTGETAEQASRAALAQFGPVEEGSVRVIPNVLNPEALEQVVLEAKRAGAMLVYTLVGPKLRQQIGALTEKHGVVAADLLGVLITRLAGRLGRDPFSIPGLGHELDDEYFRRVAAVEFAVRNDDGKNPQNLPQADIVLVGISRTSKTPLSNHIAHRGYKVANVSMVLDVPPPQQLAQVDPRRVFALTIDPVVLMNIRRARIQALGMSSDSEYANLRQIRREIQYAKRFFATHPEWTVIDMSRKAVEEAASTVVEVYHRRFVARPGKRKTAPGGAPAPAKEKARKKAPARRGKAGVRPKGKAKTKARPKATAKAKGKPKARTTTKGKPKAKTKAGAAGRKRPPARKR